MDKKSEAFVKAYFDYLDKCPNVRNALYKEAVQNEILANENLEDSVHLEKSAMDVPWPVAALALAGSGAGGYMLSQHFQKKREQEGMLALQKILEQQRRAQTEQAAAYYPDYQGYFMG